ncbi:St12p protein [Arabidopsis thaliana]|jgi:prolactin regulatory element-binding protein|uniref:SEC12-like protein n=1 Tax=Arabidopsis thaliana TaxID=3702 RepID=Q9FGP3_ARATH|nr:Transducin/WD40 repeat-like superfamily protein [Arabidopsis thaliana]NP_680414.1 Transducin/WD40 repeat-like superfamily protein [Arabidopsis thaliana]ABM05998.1 At5g50550 [Arabidopsis thaliana]AED95957.1 Transducin/WD40 repeat-like superfamily protein [Arabidopsis thaliana]AED95973.1 Transducin/WD40 repeat-like superfamily protein [Arabidopsis thaliana]BAB09140.1 St12p protein [Arabidopsis thaliana]BAD94692.1 St12p protein [Arabidopsis thaliana]|eukprot:NP_568738.1 Transducin/WD40 repeat-like superfamily protein [Arabidopsis thaliana]
MASNQQPPSNLQTYGVPIYAVDWILEEAVRSKITKDQDDDDDDGSSSSSYIVLSGGGGEGRSGIPNVILICRVDLHTNSLSEQPIGRRVIGTDLPYRMAIHPRQGGLICALPNSCRLFDWENIIEDDNEEESEKVVKELKDVGQQLSLSFNQDGTVLATGAEDGTLRVFEWPSMKTLLNESKTHASVKSLTFSESGKFLVSLGAPLCRVWDVNASAAIASLSKEKDEMFASCRFSVDNSGSEVLYVAANTQRGGSIITWDTTSWRRRSSKLIKRNNSISAFNVSADGKLLAVGTLEGDVLIIDSTKMQTNQIVKKAHLGLVTALTFSPDSRCLVSVSFDSRARLTVIKQKGEKRRVYLWVAALLFVLVYVVLYYLMVAMGIIH